MVSFSIMLFFLGDSGNLDHGKTDVLHSQEHPQSEEHQSDTDLEAAYLSYAETSDTPLFLTDSKGKIKYSSDDFCKILGKRCKRVIGEKLFDFIYNEDLADFIDQYTELFQDDGSEQILGPLRLHRKNKETLVILEAKPVFDASDKILGIVFLVNNLTEQIDAMDDEDDDDSGEKEENNWMKKLYPRIDEMEDSNPQLIVDKITYTENE